MLGLQDDFFRARPLDAPTQEQGAVEPVEIDQRLPIIDDGLHLVDPAFEQVALHPGHVERGHRAHLEADGLGPGDLFLEGPA